MKINNYSALPKFAALVALILSGYGAAAQVPSSTDCGPSFIPSFSNGCGTSSNSYIKSLSTTGGSNNITNNNTNCGNTTTSYSDYTGTSMKVTQEAGKSIDVHVTWQGGANNVNLALVKIYVDWNRDGHFDVNSDEFIALPGGTTSSYKISSTKTYPVPVPGHAKDGLTRMRVVVGATFLGQFDPNTGPCGTANYGEAEDYTFEVINPCVPPNVISISNVDYKSGDFSWTDKANAEFYEYVITPVDTIPHDTVIGFTFTTNSSINVDTFQCDTKYYVLVRVICDTAHKARAVEWSKSQWARDSFITQPCCYTPKVKVDKVTSTTARASWDPVQTALGYEYAVSTLTTPPQKGTFTINNVVQLQGLSSRQTYFVHVRSRCTPTPLSDWTKTAFKTEGPLSVDEINGASFSMLAYPSPIQNMLTVELKGEIGNNAQLTVVDLTGKVVYNTSVTANNMTIDASGWASGIYVVKYADDTHNTIMRVSK